LSRDASQAKPTVPNAASVIYARANEIAQERYPNGAGATILADIVREAARELGLMQKRKAAERVKNPYEGRHNRLDLLPPAEQIEARRRCSEVCADSPPACVERGFVCYRCQDWAKEAVSQSERTGA
jgi:hypothetical protein